MFKEFKEFATRGSVMDLAVGVIIGTAFGKIVGSLVSDVLMPPLGLILKKVDFKELMIQLATDAEGKPVGIRYGSFVNAVIEFLIVTFVIFLVIKMINRLNRTKPAPPAPPNTKECPLCLSAIPIKALKCAHCTADLKAA